MNKNALYTSIAIIIVIILYEGKSIAKEAPPYIEPPNPVIDYEKDSITELAHELKREDTTDTIWAISSWVYTNIEYRGESLSVCRSRSASQVLTDRWGDCTGMSKLTLALLSANGIKACMMGGCISTDQRVWDRCSYESFTLVPPKGAPPPEVKVPQVLGQRIENGFPLKAGTSHSWVRAWDGRNKVIVEPSSGVVLTSNCVAYAEAGPQCLSGGEDPLLACVVYLGSPLTERQTYNEYLEFCNAY